MKGVHIRNNVRDLLRNKQVDISTLAKGPDIYKYTRHTKLNYICPPFTQKGPIGTPKYQVDIFSKCSYHYGLLDLKGTLIYP